MRLCSSPGGALFVLVSSPWTTRAGDPRNGALPFFLFPAGLCLWTLKLLTCTLVLIFLVFFVWFACLRYLGARDHYPGSLCSCFAAMT